MPFWLLDAGCYLRLAERPTPRSLCRAGRSFRSRPAARMTSESCTRSCLGRHRDTALALARDKHPNTGDDEQKHRETLVDLRTSTIYIYIRRTTTIVAFFFGGSEGLLNPNLTCFSGPALALTVKVIDSSNNHVLFSRMRSEGFPFIVGGLGVGAVFAWFASCRRLSSFVVVVASQICCHWGKLLQVTFHGCVT